MRKLAIGLVLMLGVVGASAAVTVYTNEAQFLAAISSPYLMTDFVGLPSGTIYPPYMIGPQNGYAGSASGTGQGGGWLWGCSGPYGMALSTNSALDSITVDFSVSPNQVKATGGWFFPSDISCNYMSGYQSQVTLTFTDGSTPYVYTFTPSSWSDFRGFVSDVPLASLNMEAPDGAAYAWPTIDHFYIGVPEPMSLALLAVAGLLLRRR